MRLRSTAALGALLLAGCASRHHAPPPPAPPPPMPATPAAPLAGMQYLYGSGEAAALSRQAYNALVGAVRQRLNSETADPKGDAARSSAVLAPDATIADPATVPCDGKPHAVVFDADETLLLNVGFEYDEATHPDAGPFDAARWNDWERTGIDKLEPVPGAVEAVNALRRMGVTVIVNSNRSAANAAYTETALEHAGLGKFTHGETLFLEGDLGSGTGKDSRRATIAAKYCVIALGGDQLGDFSDLFNPARSTPAWRRDATQSPAIAGMWGRLWFVLPNPVYGTAIRGSFDDIFPANLRWTPGVSSTKEQK